MDHISAFKKINKNEVCGFWILTEIIHNIEKITHTWTNKLISHYHFSFISMLIM